MEGLNCNAVNIPNDILTNKAYHEDDFLYNKLILRTISKYRNVETLVFKDNPVFIYKLKKITLKIKAYLPSTSYSLTNEIFILAKNEKSPSLEIVTNNNNNKFIEALTKNVMRSSRATYIIDLKKDNKALFSNMADYKRRNIKSAEKKGVLVIRDINDAIFNAWWAIYLKTVKRGRFVPEDKKFVWALLSKKACELFTAWKDDRLLAGAVVSVNNYPFYYIGGSAKDDPELNASSLVHWHIIEHYKKKGYDIYDMGGALLDVGHGPTRFKKSFGGELLKTVHYKITLNPLFAKALGIIRHIYYDGLKRSAF
ncbi:MAG: GNAT family N-acetyltransferase [Candidatus Omnitrophica bacterium]|nr:GNAT family N-acetyltransferase [Candidatus Omnitrophota bacterium]